MKRRSRSKAEEQLTPYWSDIGEHWYGWFYDHVYRFSVHLLWPVTGAQYSAWIKRNYGLDVPVDEFFSGRCAEILPDDDKGLKGAHVIALREWQPEAESISVLTHEALHACEQVMSQRGIEFYWRGQGATNEPWAYLLQSVVYRCTRMLMATPKRRPRG